MYDLIIIGAGTAGLVTASGCARLGRKVALIERAERPSLGGECLWTGCVPTKALVASARLAHQMRHAGNYGLDPVDVRITPRSIMASMRARRDDISPHDHPEKFRNLGIDVLFGEARLVSPTEVSVGGRTLRARDIVIATGSRTHVRAIEGLKDAGWIDHASFLERDEFPRSVIILGGGAVGTEFAQLFARFGIEVTLVEKGRGLLAREDPDVSAGIHAALEGEGVRFRTGWSAKSARRDARLKRVIIESADGTVEEIAAEQIFVASGRRGNIEGLGLEELGVRTENSYLVADRYLQTSVPRIWACGDVHGGLQFTHVAAHEASVLVRNILFPGRSAVDYSNVPWAVYTDPEVARVGMTEPEAVARHGASAVRTWRVEMEDVDRAVVDRAPAGFVKVVCDAKGRILGAHILAAGASTLIPTFVLARKKGVRIGELGRLVSPYPSLADAVQRIGSLYYQTVAASWIGALGRRVAAWSR